MTSPVTTVLRRSGVRVSEAEFAALVEAALAELGPAGPDDPRAALTDADAAALGAVAADLSPRTADEPDPRAAAAAALAAHGADALPVAAVARRMRVDASRVRHRLAARRLVGVRRPDGWRLPTWQFGVDGRPLPGLEAVLRALPDEVHPMVVARFFLTPQPELVLAGSAVTPREWLAGGGPVAPVVELGAALGALV